MEVEGENVQGPTTSTPLSLTSGAGNASPLGESNINSPPPPPIKRAESGHERDEYFKKLTSTLKTPPAGKVGEQMWPQLAAANLDQPEALGRRSVRFSGVAENESLVDGFILLRIVQLINFDVYYIGEERPAGSQTARNRLGGQKSESRQRLTGADSQLSLSQQEVEQANQIVGEAPGKARDQRTLIDELAEMNPLQKYIDRYSWLASLCRVLKICLSLVAIMISLNKTLSTILLCLLSRRDIRGRPGNIGIAYEASDITMSWFVLALLNFSTMYILYATIFNGHLLRKLLSQRLFLVSRRFQYKTMLSLLVFVYLEYIVNISLVNNLFGWSFESASSDQVASPGLDSSLTPPATQPGNPATTSSANVHGGYSVLTTLETFVTEKSERNAYVDMALTIFQFARGIIRLSPYITINYVISCLNEHIRAIRNQNLLTDSLKRRQKLRMVVKSRRAANFVNSTNARSQGGNSLNSLQGGAGASQGGRKKRVIFVTETSGSAPGSGQQQLGSDPTSVSPTPGRFQSPSPISFASTTRSSGSMSLSEPSPRSAAGHQETMMEERRARGLPGDYLSRIESFDELESYVTNLYIFTGRLNRLMSQQGLAIFFIVHNLLITCSLIVPEAISGGPPMASLIRLLVVIIGIAPFVRGQKLNGQLGQLSKQIDRIIIQQQFTGRKRDNLIRIRELLHDIRVNCGGMLNFNLETGIKYLLVAFACAFFIEQEGKFARGTKGARRLRKRAWRYINYQLTRESIVFLLLTRLTMRKTFAPSP